MKEVVALRDFVMEPKRFVNMRRGDEDNKRVLEPTTLRLTATHHQGSAGGIVGHTHDIVISAEDFSDLMHVRAIMSRLYFIWL